MEARIAGSVGAGRSGGWWASLVPGMRTAVLMACNVAAEVKGLGPDTLGLRLC